MKKPASAGFFMGAQDGGQFSEYPEEHQQQDDADRNTE